MKKLLLIVAVFVFAISFNMCKDVDSDTDPGTGNHGGAGHGETGGGGHSASSDADGTYIHDIKFEEDYEKAMGTNSILPAEVDEQTGTADDEVIGSSSEDL